MLLLIIIEVYISFNYLLGNVLNELGRKEEAIKDYTKAIDINPHNDADVYYNRGLFNLI